MQLVGFVRTALLFALAVTLALFVAQKLHADLGGLWIVLSAVTMLKPKVTDSFAIARNQVLGTTVGVCFGAVFGLMHQIVISVALAVFLTALVCSIPNLRQAANIACLAAAIVILLPAGKPAYITAYDRFIDTIIGAIIALLIAAVAARTYRWWPAVATPG